MIFNKQSTRLSTFGACLLSLLVTVAAPSAPLASSTPLLQANKETLYQRVLSRPGAILRSSPESKDQSQKSTPFTAYYVYSREQRDGAEWLQIGLDTRGRDLNWIPAAETMTWNQALTVAFRNPVGRDRVLLFKDRDTLRSLAVGPDMDTYRALYRDALNANSTAESPVVGVQPEAHLDIQDDFYLVPIVQHQDTFMAGEKARILEVSTVPLKAETPVTVSARAEEPKQAADPYRSGIVFVIDSTTSMGPYIDRTRDAVRKIYTSIDDAGLREKVSFGLVAYRDSLDAVPALKYLSKTYADLESGLSPEGFFSQVNSVSPAEVSSRGFVEDAYAGVRRAIEDMDWSPYAARYVVVITDAGPRPGSDPLSSTGLSGNALRQLALDKGVSLWALHLKTPIGERDHPMAEARYRSLSTYPGIGDFYYGVGTGDVDEFGDVLETLATEITQQVKDTAEGKEPRIAPPSPDVAKAEVDKTQLAQLQSKVRKLGYALRMQYLQRQKGTQAPDVFNAWLVDRDFNEPTRQSLEVRVLLTRNQLSDMQNVLRQVLVTAEEGVLSPQTFLDDLKSLAATISRDPAAAGASTRSSGGGENLADMGYMREYIDDLPYTGEVMNLTISDWEEWPAKEQLRFIHRLEAKINYYQAIHDNTDLWIALDDGPITGDAVFPVVLDLLP